MNTVNSIRSSFEMASSVPAHHKAFDLVVIQPVSFMPGKVVFTATIHAESVSKAVQILRKEVEGSGFVVLQRSAYALSICENTAVLDALVDAYERSVA